MGTLVFFPAGFLFCHFLSFFFDSLLWESHPYRLISTKKRPLVGSLGRKFSLPPLLVVLESCVPPPFLSVRYCSPALNPFPPLPSVHGSGHWTTQSLCLNPPSQVSPYFSWVTTSPSYFFFCVSLFLSPFWVPLFLWNTFSFPRPHGTKGCALAGSRWQGGSQGFFLPQTSFLFLWGFIPSFFVH